MKKTEEFNNKMISGCRENDIVQFKNGIIGKLVYFNGGNYILTNDYPISLSRLGSFYGEIECIRRPKFSWDLCPDNYWHAPIHKVAPNRRLKFTEQEFLILNNAFMNDGYRFIRVDGDEIFFYYEYEKEFDKRFGIMHKSTFSQLNEIGKCDLEVLIIGSYNNAK